MVRAYPGGERSSAAKQANTVHRRGRQVRSTASESVTSVSATLHARHRVRGGRSAPGHGVALPTLAQLVKVEKWVRQLLLLVVLISAPARALLAQEQAMVYRTSALAASGVVTNADVLFIAIHGYNSGPAQFIHLFNAASVPANGAVPYFMFWVETAQNFYVDMGTRGIRFDQGIAWSNSTTPTTRTGGVANIWISALEYRGNQGQRLGVQ